MTIAGDVEMPKPGMHVLRRAGRLALTLLVIGAAVGAGVAGHGILSARAAQTEGPPPAPHTVVAAERLQLSETVTLTRRFTGQFEAAQEVALGFEEGGTVAEVLVRAGDALAAGEPVARLDTRLLAAERARLAASRAALEAEVELARRTNDRQAALLPEGHVTRQRVDETSLRLAQLRASLAEVDAALVALDIRLSKAEIRAPFDGTVGARLLDAGAVAGPGAAVATLLEGGPSRFRVALDPALAARLAPGTEVKIETVEGRLPARLSELAPELDPATRARVAVFEVMAEGMAPPARASGDVILEETRAEQGAWVPLSALRRGPRGTWTLMVLAADGAGATVAVEAAEILHLDGDRAYVRGSFAEGVPYLPEGTHRVVPGDSVTPAEAGR